MDGETQPELVLKELRHAAEMCKWAGLYLAEKAIRDMIDAHEM